RSRGGHGRHAVRLGRREGRHARRRTGVGRARVRGLRTRRPRDRRAAARNLRGGPPAGPRRAGRAPVGDMRLILLTVVAAIVVGLLAGGSLAEFPTIKTRWWWLALIGVAMQFVTGGGTLEVALLLGSFVALLIYVIANLRAP